MPTVTPARQHHVDAGAAELIVETDGLDHADRERTWRLLGRLDP